MPHPALPLYEYVTVKGCLTASLSSSSRRLPSPAGKSIQPSDRCARSDARAREGDIVDYVDHIEIEPDRAVDLGSTACSNVRLYGVDVMALVSYDQVAVTADTKAALPGPSSARTQSKARATSRPLSKRPYSM